MCSTHRLSVATHVRYSNAFVYAHRGLLVTEYAPSHGFITGVLFPLLACYIFKTLQYFYSFTGLILFILLEAIF